MGLWALYYRGPKMRMKMLVMTMPATKLNIKPLPKEYLAEEPWIF